MNKDILPRDSECRYHGYCEAYYGNDQTCWVGVRFHGVKYGYQKGFDYNGNIDKRNTGYWLNDARVSVSNETGYCYIWDKKEEPLK